MLAPHRGAFIADLFMCFQYFKWINLQERQVKSKHFAGFFFGWLATLLGASSGLI